MFAVEPARKKIEVKRRTLSDKAFGYVRLSQDKPGQLSIDRQIDNITKINERYGLPKPEFLIDQGISGRTTSEREYFKILLHTLALPENYGCFFSMESGDRVFRSLMSYAHFQETCAINNIRLYNNDGPVVAEMLPIEATLSVMEMKKMAMRVEFKKQQLRASGDYYAHPTNFGMEKVKKRLRPEKRQSEVIRLIFELALQGMKTPTIASVLDARKIRTPRGGKNWSHSTIARILTNPIYAGVTPYWSIPDGE